MTLNRFWNAKFYVILVVFGLITSNGYAVSWDKLIDSYKEVFEDGSIVKKQYLSYLRCDLPIITDQRIKNISILENHERLVDVKEFKNERLQMLPDPSFPFEKPFFNSGLPNASKMRIGLYRKLQKMVECLDSLSTVFGYKPGQISIRIFEGLRDRNTQKMLFQKKLEEILVINPHLTMEEAELETAKWVSPVKNNIPVHSTGAAVDFGLWDAQKGDFLDVGTFGTIWGPNDSVFTFSENITDEQKKNRLYCLVSAERADLVNYTYEFWHYSSGDRYAVYWEGRNGQALYGAID